MSAIVISPFLDLALPVCWVGCFRRCLELGSNQATAWSVSSWLCPEEYTLSVVILRWKRRPPLLLTWMAAFCTWWTFSRSRTVSVSNDVTRHLSHTCLSELIIGRHSTVESSFKVLLLDWIVPILTCSQSLSLMVCWLQQDSQNLNTFTPLVTVLLWHYGLLHPPNPKLKLN